MLRNNTRVLISPLPDQEGNKLSDQTLTFASHSKKKSEDCPSNQVSAAAMTSTSDEKWRTFNCFFQSGRAKDLSAPLYNDPVFVLLHHFPLLLPFFSNDLYYVKLREKLRNQYLTFSEYI